MLKSIQLLPGIKSAGEGNSGFFVRGGSADQNLILLDEAPVYNASHLLGFFSTFNSDAIKDLSLYKGSMPAQYGGRLSSVVDIKMKDGNSKDYHVSGGLGLISSRIIAGYAYNENKYTKASPAIQGKMITASPQQVGNIWASYSITQGKMKGMGIGAGGNYVSSSWFDVTNSFAIPSYTLLDATVFYDQPAYRLALKGNNLLNKEYWNTNGTPQKPIHFLVSVTIRL